MADPTLSRLDPGDLPPKVLATLRESLLAHYDRSARDLPWRRLTDPYPVWVSEVMLQQTRVETVTDYYRRWMARFPDVETLADAELDEVLLQWQGLGYYTRARNLHGAARVIRERFGGEVPGTVDELRSLPGVGEYTAGAVASIAFGLPVPVVDGNVNRVLCRLVDVPRLTPARARSLAKTLVHQDRPGDWNQAVMELGATVCTPRSPSCDVCPVASWCGARASGRQGEHPAPARRARVEPRLYAVMVAADAAGSLLVRRQDDPGLLQGLWAFPAVEVAHASIVEESAECLADRWAEPGVFVRRSRRALRLPPVRHRFTHIDATYHPVLVEVSRPSGQDARGEDVRWIDPCGPVGVA
ncbi:MAG: A/G-specific adenine glycosylase, partial [Gemmatimonadota bacterium]|nr:A/G-specific adenine glycosylase [Gemmatimonadota bacterium]